LAACNRALSINQVFAYRLRDVRLSKRWNQQQLAEQMGRIGHPMNRSTIAKIEAGARGVGGEHGRAPVKSGQTSARPVSLDEAIAFAVALDVSPASLFLPIVREDDIALTPTARVDLDTAHAWLRGEHPLDPDAGPFYRFQRYAKRATLGDLERLGFRPDPERGPGSLILRVEPPPELEEDR
jgi:transcriptional regulator with XRE-family HTH domain